MAGFQFERQGRSRATAIGAGVYLGLLALAWLALNAHAMIVAALAVFAVPALLDLIRNPKSGMRLNENTLEWYHGPILTTLTRSDIAKLHIHLRMDRSLKVLVETANGKKHRLIQPAIPPRALLEAGLTQAGIPFQVHPFSLL
jgi:hypothetical protein